MAAPASLLLPPTSGHSASHHRNTPFSHLPPRSSWMPDLLEGFDLTSHQQRTLLTRASACNSAPASSVAGPSPGLSAASPFFLAALNLAPSGRQTSASVPLQIRDLSPPSLASPLQFPLPGFAPAPGPPLPSARPFLSPPAAQWQPAGHPPPQSSLPPPKTMSEALARWRVTQPHGGSRPLLLQEELCGAMFGQGSAFSSSMLLPGMNDCTKANSQVEHDAVQLPLPMDGVFNQCRSDFFQSSHVLGTSTARLPEVARGSATDRRDEVGSDILNPCSPSRWEDAMSASSHWPLNVPDLSLDESGGMQGQSLVVGNATEDLQLGDFCFHQWPMLEILQDADGNHDCTGGGGGSIASELGSSGHCKEGAFLSATSAHGSPLDAIHSLGSPVTVLQSCLLMESQSRSQSVTDLSQLCTTGNSSKCTSENQLAMEGMSGVHHTSASASTCEEHLYEHGSSEDDNVQGLQQHHHQLSVNSSVTSILAATGGTKRARVPDCGVAAVDFVQSQAAGGTEARGDSPSFAKPSTPVAKRRRTVSPASPSSRALRKGSPAAASALPPTRTDWKKELGSASGTHIPAAASIASPDSGASSAAKNRSGGQAAELEEQAAPQQGVTLAARSNDNITAQVLSAAASAGVEVKPVIPGNKRKRGGRGGSTTPPQAVEGSLGKHPPAKRTRTSKASQALARAEADASAALPSAPKGSPSSERESHVIAERRRRKSMNCMLATLGSLLPADGVNPKPSDRLKIVAETITYIESLQHSLKHLAQRKTELAVAQKLLTGSPNLFEDCKTNKIYPSSSTLEKSSSRGTRVAAASSSLQDGCGHDLGKHAAKQEAAVPTFPPMFTLDISGAEAFITLTCLKGSLQLFSKTLLLLESLRFRVLNAQKSTNSRTAYHMIHITDAGETRIKKEDLQAALQNLANTFVQGRGGSM